MRKPNSVQSFLITSNKIPAPPNKSMTWLMLYVCLGYHYKVIFCGFLGKVLGFEWICYTIIHGISTNHWFEQLIYVPVLWYVFYRLIVIVFGPYEGEILGKSVQRAKFFALFLATMYVYATGMHFANTIEIFSREQLNITSGELYEQIYWIDELLSHWLQFFFYFLFFAWLIVQDRLDRVNGGYIAIFTGLVHGLERAIGVIEGDNPYSAMLFGVWILIACFIRWKKHESDFGRVWKDFFFRHGLSFGVSLPIALFSYQLLFGGFIQPSEMGLDAWKVVLFAGVFISLGCLIVFFIDAFLAKKRGTYNRFN